MEGYEQEVEIEVLKCNLFLHLNTSTPQHFIIFMDWEHEKRE